MPIAVWGELRKRNMPVWQDCLLVFSATHPCIDTLFSPCAHQTKAPGTQQKIAGVENPKMHDGIMLVHRQAPGTPKQPIRRKSKVQTLIYVLCIFTQRLMAHTRIFIRKRLRWGSGRWAIPDRTTTGPRQTSQQQAMQYSCNHHVCARALHGTCAGGTAPTKHPYN